MEPGSEVWVRTKPDVWEKAVLQSFSEVKNGKIECICRIGEKNSIFSSFRDSNGELIDIKLANDGQSVKIEDVMTLPHLSEPTVVEYLNDRYSVGNIYSFSGPILIAMNPFQFITSLYSTETMTSYYTQGLMLNANKKRSSATSTASSSSSSQSSSNVSSSTPYSWAGPAYLAPAATAKSNSEPRLPPHIFAVADDAYRNMIESLKNSAILTEETNANRGANHTVIVTGESGSGKTMSAKLMMKYLAAVAKNDAHIGIEERVLSCNPILETFGNAKTVRNSNSSRYGRYIKLQFSDRGRILGADISVYLLERSRVPNAHTGVGEKGRNFHAFYQLLNAPQADLEKYSLVDSEKRPYSVEHFSYTRAGSNDDLSAEEISESDEFSDAAAYATTKDSMEKIGFSSESIDQVFSLLSAILHLGNVSFESAGAVNAMSAATKEQMLKAAAELSKKGEAITKPAGPKPGTEDSSAPAPKASVPPPDVDAANLTNQDRAVVTARSRSALETAARLIELDPRQFARSLVSSRILLRGEEAIRHFTPSKAADTRDAVAKALYGRLFHWMVNCINAKINVVGSQANIDAAESGNMNMKAFIGILDIFGFEVFPVNSFEQLCINFANETLQGMVNAYSYRLEVLQYAAEGIKWVAQNSRNDNEDVLTLIAARPPRTPGILALLDETCLVPKGDDKLFLRKIQDSFRNHQRLDLSGLVTSRGQFVLKHYACDVSYNVAGFCEKNKDTLHMEVHELLRQSKHPLVQRLFASNFIETEADQVVHDHINALQANGNGVSDSPLPKSSKNLKLTVGAQFTQQLRILMSVVQFTRVHYVRCIKPNDRSKPLTIDRAAVASQLRSGGVIEAIRVARVGYPVRMPLREFALKYRAVAARRQALTNAAAQTNHTGVGSLNTFSMNATSLSPSQLQKGVDLAQPETFLFAAAEETPYNERFPHFNFNFDNASTPIVPHENFLHSVLGVACLTLIHAMGVPLDHDGLAIQVGKTQVFLRSAAFDKLEKMRAADYVLAATTIQRRARGLILSSRYRQQRLSACVLQRAVRCWWAKRLLLQLRKEKSAVILIQKLVRGFQARRLLSLLRQLRARDIIVRFLQRVPSIKELFRLRELRRKRIYSANKIKATYKMLRACRVVQRLRAERARIRALEARAESQSREIAQLSARVQVLEVEKASVNEKLKDSVTARSEAEGVWNARTTALESRLRNLEAAKEELEMQNVEVLKKRPKLDTVYNALMSGPLDKLEASLVSHAADANSADSSSKGKLLHEWVLQTLDEIFAGHIQSEAVLPVSEMTRNKVISSSETPTVDELSPSLSDTSVVSLSQLESLRRARVSALEEEVVALSHQLQEQKRLSELELNQLKAQFSTASDAANSANAAAVLSLEATIADLQRELKEANEQVRNSGRVSIAADKEIVSLRAQITDLTSQLEVKKAEMIALNQASAETTAELEFKLSSALSKLELAEKKILELEEGTQTSSSSLEAVQQDLELLRNLLQRQTEEIEQHKCTLEQHSLESEKYQNEIVALKQTIADLQRKPSTAPIVSVPPATTAVAPMPPTSTPSKSGFLSRSISNFFAIPAGASAATSAPQSGVTQSSFSSFISSSKSILVGERERAAAQAAHALIEGAGPRQSTNKGSAVPIESVSEFLTTLQNLPPTTPILVTLSSQLKTQLLAAQKAAKNAAMSSAGTSVTTGAGAAPAVSSLHPLDLEIMQGLAIIPSTSGSATVTVQVLEALLAAALPLEGSNTSMKASLPPLAQALLPSVAVALRSVTFQLLQTKAQLSAAIVRSLAAEDNLRSIERALEESRKSNSQLLRDLDDSTSKLLSMETLAESASQVKLMLARSLEESTFEVSDLREQVERLKKSVGVLQAQIHDGQQLGDANAAVLHVNTNIPSESQSGTTNNSNGPQSTNDSIMELISTNGLGVNIDDGLTSLVVVDAADALENESMDEVVPEEEISTQSSFSNVFGTENDPAF